MKFGEENFDALVEKATADAIAKVGQKLKESERLLIKLGAAAGVHHTIQDAKEWSEANKGFAE